MKFNVWKGQYSGRWRVSFGTRPIKSFGDWQEALDWANDRASRALNEVP